MSDLSRQKLEGALGHRFRDGELLVQALTHRSYANERGAAQGHNERLEFLGDAVLSLSMSHLLVERFPARSEGELSRLRAAMVSAPTLARLAGELGFGACLRLGRGEELTGGREKVSLLADAYEAVLAAVYLDGGIEEAFRMVRAHFAQSLADLERDEGASFDAKTRLQERVQAERRVTPRYRVVATSGPEHEKIFETELLIEGEVVARGSGRNKKEAEQQAAAAALEIFAARDAAGAGAPPEGPREPDGSEGASGTSA